MTAAWRWDRHIWQDGGIRQRKERTMCVAYPGTVIELRENGKKAMVDFSGTRTLVQTGFIPVQENDRVLVHAGCVLQVLKKEDADAMDEIFAEIAKMEQEQAAEAKPLVNPASANDSGHSTGGNR